MDLHENACKAGHEIYQLAEEKLMEKAVKEKHLKILKPSQKDISKLMKTAEDVIWVDWVKKMEKKGLPGKEVLDRYLALLKKYHEQNPFK
jgi:hypothetical protein